MGVPLWELAAQPVFYTEMALIAESAEAEAAQVLRERAAKKSKKSKR